MFRSVEADFGRCIDRYGWQWHVGQQIDLEFLFVVFLAFSCWLPTTSKIEVEKIVPEINKLWKLLLERVVALLYGRLGQCSKGVIPWISKSTISHLNARLLTVSCAYRSATPEKINLCIRPR